MPSIEIACIGLLKPSTPPKTSFDVIYEQGLTSHRSPNPLFQADLDELSGWLFHLGNPGLTDGDHGFFFAYELLSESARDTDPPTFLEFASEHVESAHRLLEWLLRTSPARRLLFTSDWQSGPDQPFRSETINLEDFWELHDSRTLRLNAAYPIAASE